jgi:hypothetical protein
MAAQIRIDPPPDLRGPGADLCYCKSAPYSTSPDADEYEHSPPHKTGMRVDTGRRVAQP